MRVQLFATAYTGVCQASLSITNSLSLLKLMSIESVMPSNHLISITHSVDMTLSMLQEIEEDRGVCCVAALGVPKESNTT